MSIFGGGNNNTIRSSFTPSSFRPVESDSPHRFSWFRSSEIQDARIASTGSATLLRVISSFVQLGLTGTTSGTQTLHTIDPLLDVAGQELWLFKSGDNPNDIVVIVHESGSEGSKIRTPTGNNIVLGPSINSSPTGVRLVFDGTYWNVVETPQSLGRDFVYQDIGASDDVYAIDTGSGSYTLRDGDMFYVQIRSGGTSTGISTPTLAINSGTAKNIDVALQYGALVENAVYQFVYDLSLDTFLVLNPAITAGMTMWGRTAMTIYVDAQNGSNDNSGLSDSTAKADVFGGNGARDRSQGYFGPALTFSLVANSGPYPITGHVSPLFFNTPVFVLSNPDVGYAEVTGSIEIIGFKRVVISGLEISDASFDIRDCGAVEISNVYAEASTTDTFTFINCGRVILNNVEFSSTGGTSIVMDGGHLSVENNTADHVFGTAALELRNGAIASWEYSGGARAYSSSGSGGALFKIGPDCTLSVSGGTATLTVTSFSTYAFIDRGTYYQTEADVDFTSTTGGSENQYGFYSLGGHIILSNSAEFTCNLLGTAFPGKDGVYAYDGTVFVTSSPFTVTGASYGVNAGAASSLLFNDDLDITTEDGVTGIGINADNFARVGVIGALTLTEGDNSGPAPVDSYALQAAGNSSIIYRGGATITAGWTNRVSVTSLVGTT